MVVPTEAETLWLPGPKQNGADDVVLLEMMSVDPATTVPMAPKEHQHLQVSQPRPRPIPQAYWNCFITELNFEGRCCQQQLQPPPPLLLPELQEAWKPRYRHPCTLPILQPCTYLPTFTSHLAVRVMVMPMKMTKTCKIKLVAKLNKKKPKRCPCPR